KTTPALVQAERGCGFLRNAGTNNAAHRAELLPFAFRATRATRREWRHHPYPPHLRRDFPGLLVIAECLHPTHPPHLLHQSPCPRRLRFAKRSEKYLAKRSRHRVE